jgi:predicted amidohydrolase
MRTVRVAAAQYPIDELADLSGFEMKLSRWVAEAVGEGAELLVFPEYGAMELTSLAGRKVAADLAASISTMQDVMGEVDALHAALARRHRVHILASSAPLRQTDGRYANSARLFAPSNGVGIQQKLMLNRFEREKSRIAPGEGLRVFDTAIGLIGIAIGYDAELPLIARALAAAGAEIILVPSATNTLAGYNRMRIAAAARALENQCYVVLSPTVGEARWSPAVDENIGAAGLFAPPDRGLPDDGVIAVGELNRPGWVHAALDLDPLAAVRRSGDVLNFRHWEEQPGAHKNRIAELVRLR